MYRLAGKDFIFKQSLPARPAGRDGSIAKFSVSVAGSDGYGFEQGIGIPAVGIIGCRPLGAKPRRLGGIFLVAAHHRLSIVKKDGCAYAEMAVWGIRAICGFLGFLNKHSLRGVKFFRQNLNDSRHYLKIFHV